jgi:hypothetical protein
MCAFIPRLDGLLMRRPTVFSLEIPIFQVHLQDSNPENSEALVAEQTRFEVPMKQFLPRKVLPPCRIETAYRTYLKYLVGH